MLFEFAKQLASLKDVSFLLPINHSKLEAELIKADLSFSAGEWVSFSALFAFLLSLISFFLSRLIFHLTEAFLFSLILFFLLVIALLLIPSYIKNKRAEEVEMELPLVLRVISVELQMQHPFELAIRNISEGDYGEVSKEMKAVIKEVEIGGNDVSTALMNLTMRVDSELFKKAIEQLIFIYEYGGVGEGLEKLAQETMLLQRTKIREFSNKLGFWGLIFIAISCIIPALFASYIIIGSSFLALTFTVQEVYFAFVLLFPLAAAAALLYLKETSPKIISM